MQHGNSDADYCTSIAHGSGDSYQCGAYCHGRGTVCSSTYQVANPRTGSNFDENGSDTGTNADACL